MKFKWPAETAAALLGGWNIKLNLAGLVASARLIRDDVNAAVFEGLVWPGANSWVWWRARVDAHAPKARFWFQVGYGSRRRTAPTFPRDIINAHVTGKPPVVIEAPSAANPRILHGQGITLRSCEVDFTTEAVTWTAPVAFVSTNYVPRDATQTGGLWQYMETFGQDVGAKSIDYWREQLYPMGAYGGKFMHDGDEFRFVTEVDVPDAVAGSRFHEHGRDKGWIKYTDPDAPWHDRSAFGLVEADTQHNEILDTVAQCCEEWPDDEGFKMLLIAGAEFWLKAQPGRPKGTTHHYGEVGRRGAGRNMKTFVWLHRALDAMGQHWLRDAIAFRGLARWEWTKRAAVFNLQDHGHLFSYYGDQRNAKLINPSEVGIHFSGLEILDRYLNTVGLNDGEVDTLKAHFAEFLFNQFRDDWTQHPGQMGIAWTVDGKPPFAPTSMDRPTSPHFAWWGAVNYTPRNEAEAAKLAKIKAIEIPERFKGGNF